MSALFNTAPSYMDHGSGSSVDSTALDAQTWMFWLYPTQVTSANRRLVRKTPDGVAGVEFYVGNVLANGQFYYNRGRATTATNVYTATGVYTINEWQFYCLRDADGVAPTIFRGTLTTPPAEVSYGGQTTGVGAPTDDSGVNLFIGGRNAGTTQSGARVARVWIYPSSLTDAQVTQHWGDMTTMLAGCALNVDYYSATAAVDLSGNGNNGTGTSVTLADHVPMNPWAAPSKLPGDDAAAAAATYGRLLLLGVG